jgi:hypothetical protein
MSTIDTDTPSYLSTCQATVRQLLALAADFKRIAENTAVSPEHRYALALNGACYGRVLALFKELGVDLHVGDLSPRILGHDTCLHLIGEAIKEKLDSLSGLLAEPA